MKTRTVWTSALLASTFGLLLTGCHGDVPAPGEAPIVDGNAAATDPAAANLLPANVAAPAAAPATRVAARSFAAPQQVSAETYPQQAGDNYGPGNSQQNEAYRYNTQQPQYQYTGDPAADAAEYDQYADLLDPNVPQATQPPPPLPADYQQPEAPGPDYLWTPGYWDYATAGYYYVPGSWVSAPYAGALWTPGWWGASGGRYRWHRGYWGRHVGYYGGINYGFGYIGFGYQGGYWNNNHFWYNRNVLRVNPRSVNNYVYQRNVTVVNREYVNNTRVSYFGGNGGLRRGPAPQEFAALREQRIPPMQAQIENRRAAEANRQQFYTANNGRPQMMYTSRPLTADRNIQAPPRTMPQQNFVNGGRPGFENRQAVLPANANPQQRQQFEQQQRMQLQQQANVLRDQNLQQRNQQMQIQNQQRNQLDQQRNQMQQQRNLVEQQRQQANVQRDQNLQQRNQNLQQRNQQMQIQNQQRVQQDQQRQQVDQQRQQANTQRDQMMQQQRNQQMQVQNQQRAQEEQQRNQQVQQRQQMDAQRQQQQQANVQREQQANAQRQQQDQQRAQQQQLRQQQDQQRVQQQQQMNVQREQMQAQRQQQMQQRMQQQAARPAPAQRMEAPRPAPAPHAEAPHGGGGEHRR